MSLDTLQSKPRQMTRDDLREGAEFTIAQITTVNDLHYKTWGYQLRVGDVLKIGRCYHTGFNILVNGKSIGRSPRMLVPISDVSFITIIGEE